MKKHIFLVLIAVIALADISLGQCVMCKAVGEQSADQGDLGRGLNAGIMLLMIVPYILLSIGGIIIYKRFNKEKESSH